MNKITRRRFLKGLGALSIALPSLKDIEVDSADLQLTDETIETISNIEKIELEEYSPYCPDNDPMQYRVTFRDGTSEEYFDICQLFDAYKEVADELREKFGLPYIRYYHTHPDQPPWWK